jgi:hypothetical protein
MNSSDVKPFLVLETKDFPFCMILDFEAIPKRFT